MKRTIKMTMFLFVLTLAMAQLATGEVPATISYQGILSDTNGTLLNGNCNITATYTIRHQAGQRCGEKPMAALRWLTGSLISCWERWPRFRQILIFRCPTGWVSP